MVMKVSFYLKRPNDNRVTGLIAQFNYNMSSYRYYLLEKIHPADWNFKTQCAKQGANSAHNVEFNQRLKTVSAQILEAFYNYQNTHKGGAPTKQIFNEILDEIFNKQSQARIDREVQRTFWGFFQNLIDRMESGSRVHVQKSTPLAVNTIRNMRNLMNHLRDYQEYSRRNIEFDTIDMTFYYGFVDYLTKVKKLNINSIGKHITQIKVVMREALELDFTSNTIFTHRKFRSASAETDAIYLNDQEVEALYNLDFSGHKKLERVRDLFVIGCYTGQRFSDLSLLSVDNIDNDILEVRQVKTGERVYIPLQPEVKAIMRRYDNGFPNAMSNQKFNDYLKDVCAECEMLKKEVSIKTFVAGQRTVITQHKYLFVKSHTARRSFATNEYLKGELTMAEIRAVTGHKTDKAFYKYVRVAPRENAENIANKWRDRAARKMRVVADEVKLRAV
jgi:integrase